MKVGFFGFFTYAATTHDQDVFSFNANDTFCNGFEEVLMCYREIVPQLRLAGLSYIKSACLCSYSFSTFFLIFFAGYVTGPTSFAPIIERAITIVEESGGQYHVLLIIADGQVKNAVLEPGL